MPTEVPFAGLLSNVMAESFSIGVGTADRSLEESDYIENDAFEVFGANRSGASIALPTCRAIKLWRSDQSNTYAVSIRVGAGTVTIEPGQTLVIITDGLENGVAGSELTGVVTSSAWQTVTFADSPFQAIAGNHLDIDSTGGPIIVLMPPPDELDQFDEVFFSNNKNTLAANPLTVLGNGSTFMNVFSDQELTVDQDGLEFSLRFDGETLIIPGGVQ